MLRKVFTENKWLTLSRNLLIKGIFCCECFIKLNGPGLFNKPFKSIFVGAEDGCAKSVRMFERYLDHFKQIISINSNTSPAICIYMGKFVFLWFSRDKHLRQQTFCYVAVAVHTYPCLSSFSALNDASYQKIMFKVCLWLWNSKTIFIRIIWSHT